MYSSLLVREAKPPAHLSAVPTQAWNQEIYEICNSHR